MFNPFVVPGVLFHLHSTPLEFSYNQEMNYEIH